MGLIDSCLSKGKEEPLLSNTEYIDQMDEQIAALQMKINQMELKVANDRLAAERWAKQENKQQALNYLKMMKQKQQTLAQWNAIFLKLVQIRHEVDVAMVTEQVASNFKRANDILKYATKRIDVDSVVDLMDEIEDNVEIINEVNQLLAKTKEEEIELEKEEEVMYEEVCKEYEPKKKKKVAIKI
jgi:hypothetical protein